MSNDTLSKILQTQHNAIMALTEGMGVLMSSIHQNFPTFQGPTPDAVYELARDVVVGVSNITLEEIGLGELILENEYYLEDSWFNVIKRIAGQLKPDAKLSQVKNGFKIKNTDSEVEITVEDIFKQSGWYSDRILELEIVNPSNANAAFTFLVDIDGFKSRVVLPFKKFTSRQLIGMILGDGATEQIEQEVRGFASEIKNNPPKTGSYPVVSEDYALEIETKGTSHTHNYRRPFWFTDLTAINSHLMTALAAKNKTED